MTAARAWAYRVRKKVIWFSTWSRCLITLSRKPTS